MSDKSAFRKLIDAIIDFFRYFLSRKDKPEKK